MKLRVLLLLIALGCSSKGAPPPKPLPPSPTGSLEEMCRHLAELGCEEGKAVYNDNLPGPVDVPNQSCEDFYAGLEKDGIAVNAGCVASVRACSEVESCR